MTVGPFGPYSPSRCLGVEIIDDGDCEQAERFTLSLESSDLLVSFPVNNAQIVIDGTTEHDDCGEHDSYIEHSAYYVYNTVYYMYYMYNMYNVC